MTQCQETTYSGTSQYDQLVGRQCRREGRFTVTFRNGNVKVLCKQHADMNVRRYEGLTVEDAK